jgi:CheY-like chemotaxis protein
MGVEPLILIVDDDSILLESIADLLLLADFQVITAGNGIEALQAMERRQPDCIVTDVMMPEMDGFTLLETVRQNEAWEEIPIILITAYEHPLSEVKRSSTDPDAILAKPFDIDQLVSSIRELLG